MLWLFQQYMSILMLNFVGEGLAATDAWCSVKASVYVISLIHLTLISFQSGYVLMAL